MRISESDIDRIDYLVSKDNDADNIARMTAFTNIFTAMVVIHGTERVASMLRSLVDTITDGSGVDELHDAYMMRKEMFSDLEEL